MFDKILDAYQNKDETLFEARVRNLLDAGLPCPFESGSAEHALYSKAVMAHKRWRAKGISSRYAKVQMLDYFRQIAELQKDKPKESVAEMPVAVNEVKLEEPVHMTGVLPEKIHFFKKKVKDDEGQ